MYTSQDFYLLRRPTNSVNDFFSICENVSKGGQEHFKEVIGELFSSQEKEEAIYLASPNLHLELKKWQQGEIITEERCNKLALSLYKYLKRMSLRCTPFGLFAGYANGSISDNETNITFPVQESCSYQKQVSLDMNCVDEMVNHLLQVPAVRNQLVFFPNNSLYKVGNKLRYTEFRIKNKRKSYLLASVTNTPLIQEVLHFAESGKKISEITNLLMNKGVSDENNASEFVNQLIEQQMLISELAPNVTGTDYFTKLNHKIRTIEGAEKYSHKLSQIQKILNKSSIGIKEYPHIKDLIKEDFPSATFKDLVQVDVSFPTTYNNLNRSSVDLMVKNLGPLISLFKKIDNYNLSTFREKFLSKFGTKEVPLAVALDSEVGVGYGLNVNGTSDFLPLLDGLAIPGSSKSTSLRWDEFTRLKYKLITTAKTEKKEVVQITDLDLSEFSSGKYLSKSLPESAYACGTILSASPNHFDNRDYKFFLRAFMGPSAANLLGRFAQKNKSLTVNLFKCLKEEENADPETVFAEIVHIPQARVGNILARPSLRKYEIPYLGQASVPKSNQIPINDLLVSVRGNKVILQSKKTGKKVIPRLSTAHNYHKGLPIYKFLCDLQFQEQELRVFWNWFPFDQEETFLPRVEYKNIILFRAQWRFKQDDYPEILKKETNILTFFNKLRENWNIPKYTVVQQGDIELFIDFDNPYCLQHLWQTFKKRDLILSEFYSESHNCFIEDNGKKYAHEIILPLKKTIMTERSSSDLTANQSTLLQRDFPIGSSWLYTKIYTGNKTGDTLLADTILPLAKDLLKNGIIDKWFFIRYNDPDPHLRIRFYNGSKSDFWKETLDLLNRKINPYIQEGTVSKIVVDTYQREIERYGANTMELSEAFFHSDSSAIAKMLKEIQGGKSEQLRWQLALKNIDMLLNDFSYSLEEKASLMNRLQNIFFHEFDKGPGKSKLKYSLDQLYRANIRDIKNILDPDFRKFPFPELLKNFTERSLINGPIVMALKERINLGHEIAIEEIVSSYIHMTLNRTFIAKRRRHELVIYHFLSKYYRSQIAGEKSLNKVKKSKTMQEVVQ